MVKRPGLPVDKNVVADNYTSILDPCTLILGVCTSILSLTTLILGLSTSILGPRSLKFATLNLGVNLQCFTSILDV